MMNIDRWWMKKRYVIFLLLAAQIYQSSINPTTFFLLSFYLFTILLDDNISDNLEKPFEKYLQTINNRFCFIIGMLYVVWCCLFVVCLLLSFQIHSFEIKSSNQHCTSNVFFYYFFSFHLTNSFVFNNNNKTYFFLVWMNNKTCM